MNDRYDIRVSIVADSANEAQTIADEIDGFMEDNFHVNLDSTAVAPELEFDRAFHDRAEAFTDSISLVMDSEGNVNKA